MSEKALENGNVFKFKRENSNIVLTYATDHSHENTIFRRQVTISGSDNFSNPSLNCYGTINSYNDDNTPNLKIHGEGASGDASILFGTLANKDWTIGVQEPNDEFLIRNGYRLDQGSTALSIDSSNNVSIPNGELEMSTNKIKFTGHGTSGAVNYAIDLNMDGDGEAYIYYIKRDNNNTFHAGYNGNDNNPPYFSWFHYNGTDWPELKFKNNGALHCDGSVITTSDLRLKENIRKLKSPLEKVCSLRGIKYDWKSKSRGSDKIGFIAQEVEKIIPEVVETSDCLADGKKGSPMVDNPKSVAYGDLVPYLVEAIKELTTKVDDLEKRLGDK